MITVENALQIILEHTQNFGTEQLPLHQSIGRILREDIKADRDFPPFNRVMMDGIAIDYQSFMSGNRSFPVEGIAAAGTPQMTLKNAENCMEVMTGAILPVGVNTVIRYEDIEIENGVATIQIEAIKEGQNIHPKGMDRQAGKIIVKEGKKIRSAEIGVAATVGKTHLAVSQTPKVIIISTGDELVEIDEQPLPHQIRKSNVHTLQAILAQNNIQADTAHLLDDYSIIVQQLSEILDDYDVILLSGGVSKGKFDFLPKALEELGVQKHFHKVKQRPGKPMWFGTTAEETTVFALPGNPVSSFVGVKKYVLPWLRTCLKMEQTKPTYAILQKDIPFHKDLHYFLQVHCQSDKNGQLLAFPVEGNGSGDLANLVDANGFLELPRGKDLYEKGNAFEVILF